MDSTPQDRDDEAPITERVPAPVVALARKPSENLITTLKRLLEQAEKGQLVGVTFLCNEGNTTRVYYNGTQDFHAQLAAWEDYKFGILFDRNLERVSK